MDATVRRLAALLILGAAALLSPVLGAFNRPATVLGVPLLPAYLFGCWAAIVVTAAFFTRRGRR